MIKARICDSLRAAHKLLLASQSSSTPAYKDHAQQAPLQEAANT
jgi:hypothetical protein